MRILINKHTKERRYLTKKQYERFFDNRDPFDWEEVKFTKIKRIKRWAFI